MTTATWLFQAVHPSGAVEDFRFPAVAVGLPSGWSGRMRHRASGLIFFRYFQQTKGSKGDFGANTHCQIAFNYTELYWIEIFGRLILGQFCLGILQVRRWGDVARPVVTECNRIELPHLYLFWLLHPVTMCVQDDIYEQQLNQLDSWPASLVCTSLTSVVVKKLQEAYGNVFSTSVRPIKGCEVLWLEYQTISFVSDWLVERESRHDLYWYTDHEGTWHRFKDQAPASGGQGWCVKCACLVHMHQQGELEQLKAPLRALEGWKTTQALGRWCSRPVACSAIRQELSWR